MVFPFHVDTYCDILNITQTRTLYHIHTLGYLMTKLDLGSFSMSRLVSSSFINNSLIIFHPVNYVCLVSVVLWYFLIGPLANISSGITGTDTQNVSSYTPYVKPPQSPSPFSCYCGIIRLLPPSTRP
jgi:hypothetical protein